jgi:hypothetical protein
LGDKLKLIGAGNGAVDVLTISLSQPAVEGGPGKGEEYVRGASRAYWVTKGENGALVVSSVDYSSLYCSARDVVLNKSLLTQMKAEAYRFALSNMIAVAERNATSEEARAAASHLLDERNKALKELNDIDERLRNELDSASNANRDADKFALGAALSGMGSSILQNVQSAGEPSTSEPTSTSEPKGVQSSSVSLQRVETPSGAVIELLKQRVEIEGRVLESDAKVGAYLQKNGRVVYVPIN